MPGLGGDCPEHVLDACLISDGMQSGGFALAILWVFLPRISHSSPWADLGLDFAPQISDSPRTSCQTWRLAKRCCLPQHCGRINR